ncbi:hypothetical protein ACFQ14_04950 [Pseudahrensia aquimaris]|uniref:Uncharacterized protein n=1 Tax=Pseudahrensia aquimaris TaxID=744461 RepID=A0ABW3FDG9_9HYPH
MNNTIIGGAFAGVLGLAVLGMAVSFGPTAPDENFDYANATAQEQADWLNTYGRYIIDTNGEEIVGKDRTITFESIDPQRKAIGFRVLTEAETDEAKGILSSDTFTKIAAELSSKEQKRLCDYAQANEMLIGDALLQITVQIDDQALPAIDVSKAACEELKNRKEPPKPPLGLTPKV